MKISKCLTFLLFLFILNGCAVHGPMQPLGKGKKQVTTGLGGPVVKLNGLYFPMPLLQTAGSYGINERTNISGTMHLFPLIFGIVSPEFQLTHYPRLMNDDNRSFVGFSCGLSAITSVKSDVERKVFLFPELGVSYKKILKNNRSFYCGGDLTVIPERSTYDDDAESFMFTPYLGYTFPLNKSLELNTELRWMASNIQTKYDAVSYQGIAGYGGITPMISLGWRF